MQRRDDIERHKKYAQHRIDAAPETIPMVPDPRPNRAGEMMPDPRFNPNHPAFDHRIAGEMFEYRLKVGTHMMADGTVLRAGEKVLMTKHQAAMRADKFERVRPDEDFNDQPARLGSQESDEEHDERLERERLDREREERLQNETPVERVEREARERNARERKEREQREREQQNSQNQQQTQLKPSVSPISASGDQSKTKP